MQPETTFGDLRQFHRFVGCLLLITRNNIQEARSEFKFNTQFNKL